jgi:formylglycine-generating enzyme required for sulfatase activity
MAFSGSNRTNTSSDARMAEVGRYWYNGGSGYSQSGDTSVGSAKVGSYLPNQWGLCDVQGNVWEWCLDWYGTCPGMVSDPKGADTGSYRVLRGGCWSEHAYSCRVAFRGDYAPGDAYSDLGFRVALPPQVSEQGGVRSGRALRSRDERSERPNEHTAWDEGNGEIGGMGDL